MKNYITAKVNITLLDPSDIGQVKEVCIKAGVLLGSTPVVVAATKTKGKFTPCHVTFEVVAFDPSTISRLADDLVISIEKVKFRGLDSDIGYEGLAIISNLCYRGFDI
jgi:hypothetical protein